MNEICYFKRWRLYKYKLLYSYTVKINWLDRIKDGKIHGDWARIDGKHLTIKSNYSWDGASGPAIDTKSTMRGSLVHDALYQLMSKGIIPLSYRKHADQELRRICIEDGMNKFRAWYFYVAVRLFARKYAKPAPKPKVLSAP